MGIMPTGFGKSIIYQLLPAAFDAMDGEKGEKAVVLVVSPLVSLMADQILRARALDIASAKLTCSSDLEADAGAGPGPS